jgi:ABC-type nitrate/sulfonate/bicarbonate transport system substrate-binding protein
MRRRDLKYLEAEPKDKLMTRYVLGVLAAAVILITSLSVRAASAPAKLVIAYAAMSPRVAPLWAAQERGFFTKNGIDAELVFVSADAAGRGEFR